MLHNPDKKVDVVAEEPKQIVEPGMQVSSQPNIEEVKQASGKTDQGISPKKNIAITGKLIFKARLDQNYLTVGRRDTYGLSNIPCLVFR